jgi:hypothetical protein
VIHYKSGDVYKGMTLNKQPDGIGELYTAEKQEILRSRFKNGTAITGQLYNIEHNTISDINPIETN